MSKELGYYTSSKVAGWSPQHRHAEVWRRAMRPQDVNMLAACVEDQATERMLVQIGFKLNIQALGGSKAS
jgi:uncharacterized SAM-dependent methyltransferase